MTKSHTPSTRSFYAGVFLVSGLLMALQIVQSRIFSVTTWYHVSFLVIGVAMFGLTLGALKVHRGDEAEQRKNYAREMTEMSFRFAIGIIVGLVGQLAFPIVSDELWVTFVGLPLVAALTLPAYYYAGAVLSLAITRAPFPVARTYGFDLLGAAAGCLFALMMMDVFDGPSDIMIFSLLALAALRCFGKVKGIGPFILAAILIYGLCLNLLSPKPYIYPVWNKKRVFHESDLVYDRWNSISRIIIRREERDASPYVWGPSPKLPLPTIWGPSPRLPRSLHTSWYELLIDGEAATPITRWTGDRGAALHFLDYDVTTIAYALPNLKSAGIVGLGGGRDVLSSLHAGVQSVTALDVNNIQVSVLSKVEPFKSYAAIGGRKDVRLINSEARSWFASNPDKFDLIQMSLVDTWAATGAGAFTLSENGLYTVEAWDTFLSHLNPGGVMTVSRWYLKDVHSEGERLLSLTVGALLKAGVKDPKQHIYVATGADRIMTMVVAKDAFTPAQLDALDKRAKDMEFGVLISPRKDVEGSELAEILNVKSWDELEALAARSEYDISPPTDWRPFFFNQIRMSDPVLVFHLAMQTTFSSLIGHAHAIANLYVIILFSLLMVIFAIVYPLRAEAKAGNRFIRAGTAWFVLIGLGFMLLEVALMQRVSVYLGHPAYGLGIVLFSLVLSTGCGSLVCDRFPLKTPERRVVWALGTAFAIAMSVFFIDAAIAAFPGAGLFVRALICVSVTAPLGLLMGFGFPTGMEMARQAHAKSTAWFWGINGAAGVMGSSLAIAINIGAGIDRSMFVSALCYALLALAGNRKERRG